MLIDVSDLQAQPPDVLQSIFPHIPMLIDMSDLQAHPEFITLRRSHLESCIYETIEKTIASGGDIQALTRDCMLALDKAVMRGPYYAGYEGEG